MSETENTGSSADAVEKQHRIQVEIDRADRESGSEPEPEAMQAGEVSASTPLRRASLDAAQPVRAARRGGCQIWCQDQDEASCPARGDRASLCFPRLATMLQLNHRRDPADHRRLLIISGSRPGFRDEIFLLFSVRCPIQFT